MNQGREASWDCEREVVVGLIGKAELGERTTNGIDDVGDG